MALFNLTLMMLYLLQIFTIFLKKLNGYHILQLTFPSPEVQPVPMPLRVSYPEVSMRGQNSPMGKRIFEEDNAPCLITPESLYNWGFGLSL